jgi:hypothetical protein
MPKFSILLAAILASLLTGCASRTWVPGWKETASLGHPRAGAAAVVVKDKIYIIGGVDGKKFISSTEYAQIRQDGALGSWQPGHSLNEERGFMEAVVHGDYVYVAGGGNGPYGHNLLRSTERARILPDGTLGAWEKEQKEMVVMRRCNKIITSENRIYSFGGFGGTLLDSVEFSEFQPDGSLGEWKLDPEAMTIPRYINSVKNKGDTFYVIGGHDRSRGVGVADVEWSRPTSSGNLQKWQSTAPMQQGRYALSSASYGDYLYAIGGISGAEYLDSIELSRAWQDGALAPWQFTTPLDRPRANFSTIDLNGRLYIIGGANREGYLSSVIYANRNSAGDIGYWGTAQEAKEATAKQDGREAKIPRLQNAQFVKSVIQTANYSYIEVGNDNGESFWIAGQKIDSLKPGDRVAYSGGINMSNWYSKELKRGFALVIFVGQIQKQ